MSQISEHGLIGDLRTCALVDMSGVVDWFCAPRFDSPSIFGSILDPDAGHWSIAPRGGAVRTSQYYYPDSAILLTRQHTESGVIELHDFMPIVRAHDPDHVQRIVRRITAVRGSVEVDMEMSPRCDYGRADPVFTETEAGLEISGDHVRLLLTGSHAIDTAERDATARFTLKEGESACFVLEVAAPLRDGGSTTCSGTEFAGDPDTGHLFDATADYWTTWLSQSRYTGRWRERVQRSAITLKLLTHEPSGAIIAAPTTSLPEHPGGERNWDYRYVWIRDAAFSLYALLRLGFLDEASSFMRWLSERIGERDADAAEELGPLRVLYDIDGEDPVAETELDHLRGYADSKPVRIGNAAVHQLQLDIYGELIDSIYLFNKYGPGISHDAWADLVEICEWVCEHWDRDDAGMWEVRDEYRAHTSSRLLCWVAVERMVRMARQRGLPGDTPRWMKVRDEITASLLDDCWDDEVGAFMQYAGSDAVDASTLLMPLLKFTAGNDPKFLSTLRVIEERLVSDSLVFRYDLEASTDGLDGEEGTFSLCSFWYVEALTRAGRTEDARLALEKMFTYANHLGLYAEQVGLTGEQLGNFPQAFTHLGMISAVLNLDRALG